MRLNGRFLFLTMAVFFFFASFAGAADTIVLTYATAFTHDRDHEMGTRMFIDMVTKFSNNRVKFTYKGGPEAIPPFELVESVRRGLVDFAEDPAGYYMAQLPIANGMRLSMLHPWSERINGATDLFRKVLAEKVNLYYLGKVNPGATFQIYSRKKVTSSADLKGMKIRSTPTYKDFLIALQAVPVTMPHSEIFTALERGTVDAVCSPAFGMQELGWHEKIKYVIFPPFYQQDQTIIFNLDSWKKLPPDIQKLMEDVIVLVERDSMKFIRGRMEQARQDFRKVGAAEVMLTDADRYLKLAYDSAWKDVLSKSDPEEGKKLRELWTNPVRLIK